MRKIKPKPLTETEELDLVKDLRSLYLDGIRTILPLSREDCSSVPRPCPYVSCKYNTYLDISKDGSILITNKKGLLPSEVNSDTSCTLDIVEANPSGMSNQAISDILDVSRETVRLIVMDCLSRARQELLFIEDGPQELSLSRKNALSKKIVSLERSCLDSILIKSPLLGVDNLLDLVKAEESRFTDAEYVIARYSGLLPDNEIASILDKPVRHISGLKIKLGYNDNARPGEYSKSTIQDVLNVSDSLFNSWVEQGLRHRLYECETYVSRSDLLQFFIEHSKAFYLLKYDQPGENLFRLDFVEKYHRRFE